MYVLYVCQGQILNVKLENVISEVPSKPGRPEIQEIGDNFITLNWEPPLTDGGSQVVHYILERREVCHSHILSFIVSCEKKKRLLQ